jgi:hypothetical protein
MKRGIEENQLFLGLCWAVGRVESELMVVR